jgi:hypothetical protein
VLEIAREKRQPRPPGTAPRHPPHPGGAHAPHAAPRRVESEMSNSKATRIIAAVAGVLVLAGGIAWWAARPDGTSSDGSEIASFVEQMVKAAQGEAPATHMFGGTLKVGSMGGVPVVTAQGVPPRICAASGMRLVKKGLLSVNGVTPTRVSSAIITELCNKEDGDATIMWAPK